MLKNTSLFFEIFCIQNGRRRPRFVEKGLKRQLYTGQKRRRRRLIASPECTQSTWRVPKLLPSVGGRLQLAPSKVAHTPQRASPQVPTVGLRPTATCVSPSCNGVTGDTQVPTGSRRPTATCASPSCTHSNCQVPKSLPSAEGRLQLVPPKIAHNPTGILVVHMIHMLPTYDICDAYT